MGKEHWATITHRDQTPGPGAYDVGNLIGKDSLKYTIRKRNPEKVKETANVPMLNLPGTLSSRAVMLPPHSPTPRSSREGKETPGPSYIPPSLGKKPVSARLGIKTQDYDPPKKQVEPSYGKNPFGPAEYNTREDVSLNSHVITIGVKANEKNSKDDNPAPDKYEVKYPEKKYYSSICSFGTRETVQPGERSPGPGTYKVETDFGKKNYRIHERTQEISSKFFVPGPGTYDTPQFGANLTPRSLRGSTRKERKTDDVPFYSIPSSFDRPKGITIGSRKSSSMKRKREQSDEPGPGHYTPKAPTTTHTHTISRHVDLVRPKKYGAYEINREEPGPGTYNPDFNAGKSRTPAFTLKDNCGAISNAVHEPSPPFYDLPDRIGSNSPKFTLKGRTKKVERVSFTQEADYYILPSSNQGPYHSIHLRDTHDLAPN